MKLHRRDWANLAKMVLNQIEQSRIINTLISYTFIHSFTLHCFNLCRSWWTAPGCRRCRRGLTRGEVVVEAGGGGEGQVAGGGGEGGGGAGEGWQGGEGAVVVGAEEKTKREIKSWDIWQDAGLQLSHSHFSWRIEKGRIQFWSKKIEQLSCQREDVDRWTIS